MRIALGTAFVLMAAAVPFAAADHWDPFCPHGPNHSHTYGLGGSVGARSDTATGGDEVGAGVVTVQETNANDCNNDGIPGDYDGDWDTGIGGGFFGYGPWAHEPTCDYGLTTHGATVTVTNFGWDVAFVIGADQTAGPTISVDPIDGSISCSTDGNIEPCSATNPSPTCGPSDCLTTTFFISGTTCGAGGDGGYWVFLSGAFVSEGSGGVAVSNPPTVGVITA